MLTTRRLFLLSLLVLITTWASAQNMTEDLLNNNLEGLKKKVLLLSPNFKEAPYLSLYMSKAQLLTSSMLDYLIAQGADLNQVDEAGFGPLYYAIRARWDYAFDKLTSLKVNPNTKWKTDAVTFLGGGYYTAFTKKDVFQLTPLAVAVRTGNAQMAQKLLDLGADPLLEIARYVNPQNKATVSRSVFSDVVDTFAQSVLPSSQVRFGVHEISVQEFAAGALVWKAVQKLPAKKQPKVAPAQTKNLFAALVLGDMKAFKTELGRSGDNTLAFLPYAAEGKNWEVVDLICQYNSVDINSPILEDPSASVTFFSGNGTPKVTLLAWVITNGSVDAARFLVTNGAKMPVTVTYQTQDGSMTQSPLVYAVQVENVDLIQFMLEQKLDINETRALRFCHSDWTRDLLVEAGADLNITSIPREGSPAVDLLFDAAFRGDSEAVSYYLGHGIDPNRFPDASPLLAAVSKSYPDCVSLLLKAGAKRDATVSTSDLYALRGLNGADALKVAQVLVDTAWSDAEPRKQVLDMLSSQ